MWLSSNFSPVKPLEEINFLDSSLKCDFILNGQSITSSSPITSCILYAISNAKGAYVSTEDIIAFVKSKISNFDNEKDTVTIRVELLKLVFSSILQILAIKPVAADHISQYPLASEINRMRIKNNFDILISQYNNAQRIWAIR
ncbi:MAG UNVERIFIED_CONTAM: hypothetical protein LVQ98_02305 [Rickettsiaceae bacterium]|jgi:hypothetical protein